MVRKLLIRLLLRVRPSLLALQCTECGKTVALSNVDNHNAFFHPGRALEDEDIKNVRKLSKASLPVDL